MSDERKPEDCVSEDQMQAWGRLVEAAQRFDKTGGTWEPLVDAIEALIDVKVSEGLEAFANRVQEATGVRP